MRWPRSHRFADDARSHFLLTTPKLSIGPVQEPTIDSAAETIQLAKFRRLLAKLCCLNSGVMSVVYTSVV